MEFQFFSVAGLILSAGYFFAGIVDAVCGGGGLITIPTLMLTGLPIHYITGTNQCSAVVGGVTGAIQYAKNGNVNYRMSLLTLPVAVLGSILGAKLNLIVPERVLMIVMVVLIPLIAAIMIFNKMQSDTDRSDTLRPAVLYGMCILMGLVLGTYQGFYGAGAGMFYTLLFASVLRLDMLTSSGNSRFISAASCLAASFSYALSGTVVWKMVIAATVFHTAGTYVGVSLAVKKGAKVIRPMMLVVLALLMIRVLTDLF